MRIRALGVELEVDLEALSLEQRTEIICEWNECLVTDKHSSNIDADIIVPGPGNEQTSYALHRDVTQFAIAKQIGHLHMFHACAVADDNGSVVGFVARSGTGKTTAARRLAQKYHYVTDETLACDSDGNVFPFPKPLSIKSTDHTGKIGRSPGDAGLRTLKANQILMLHALVLLQREPERATPPELVPIPVHEAIGHIAPETSSLLAVPNPLSALAGLLTRSGGPWLLRYRDIADCDYLIDKLFEQLDSPSDEASEEDTWIELGPGPIADAVRDKLIKTNQLSRYGTLNRPTRIISHSRIQRRPWSDAIKFSDGYYVISTDAYTLVLSSLGGYLWEQCEHPISITRLTSLVQEEFGENPDAEKHVIDALQSLFDADLIDEVSNT
ncbi:MAG: hypothetical protein Q4P71_03385 [Actinomycetaceae bacterium]|nr:hypothetical protein [Actinomycetaceae bacterium]